MFLKVENLSMTYDKKVLYDKASFSVDRGEKIGIVGSNGTGKTTLINILNGDIIPDSGTITIGETIKIGYFHQQLEIKNKKLTPLEYVKEYGEYLETVNGKGDKENLKQIVADTSATIENLKKFSEKLNKRFLLFRLMF